MSYKNQIIQKILIEWAYRVDNGMPNPKNKEHISILSEVLSDLGLSEIKNELIENLLNEDKVDEVDRLKATFGNPVLNKIVTYKNKDGKEQKGLVGNLLSNPKDNPGRIAAEKLLPKDGTPERNAINNELGGEGQPSKDIEKEKKDGGEDAGGAQPETGTALKGKAGDSYRESLPKSDPAYKAPENEKPVVEPKTTKIPSEPKVVTSSDKVGSNVKTPSGKTLYSLGGGYYADNPGGTPKYIRTENIELIYVDSILSEIKAQNQKGETITVQPISDKDLYKAIQNSKKVEFPEFSKQSDDDNVNYLIGTKTSPAKFKSTNTKEVLSELEESRNDAYSGRNAGKGGASTSAQEEVSCRLIELTAQYPELKGNELIEKLVDEMEKIPFYSNKSRKQLTALAVASSAGIKIMKFVKDNEAFDYNQNQPKGFPKSFAFTGKATQTLSNFLVTKLKEAKESGDVEAIAHYENEIRKLAEHSTSATGKEGDGDTSLMYMDNNGRVRVVHITNKQAYSDTKLNATKKSRAIEIKENAVEGADVEKLSLINDIASGDVIGMNEVATNSMKFLRDDLTLKDDVDNITANIINAVYGTKTFDASDKYKKGALKNSLVLEELKKMGVDKSTATDEQIVKAVINTVGNEGSTQISDSTTGTPAKLLMKMGNLWKDVNSKFESLKSKYSQKSDDEICQMILDKYKEPKSGNPLYGGKLSAKEICSIRNNKALQKLSEISDARGESMRTIHNNIVNETKEQDVRYFMEKDNISEAEARERLENENGPHAETVVRTFMKGMHWTRSIMGDADTEMLQSIGNGFVKSEHYRDCLASLTGYNGDTTTREGKEGLVNHLAKNVRITPGDGSVQFVNNETGKTVLLGEDTWRTAGDGEKIAGHDGKDLQECLQSKQK
jgi:hypothetical protein